jgi:uncharacterized protein (TIGR01777 family)
VRIVIAGGTGFLGAPLASGLRADGHDVTVLTRRASPQWGEASWTPDGRTGPWATALDDADAVINLAGASLADRRWTTTRKELLRRSRLFATRSLVCALQRATYRPAVFVSGSAVGYYGPREAELVTEQDPPGGDFLARLTAEWEEAAAPLVREGIRVAWVRTGLALSPDGGVLRRMLVPYRLGAGGPFGSGRQYMPWIHRDDWIALVRWIIATDTADGPTNATAPEPVTNEELSATLARVLRRPHLLRVPAPALRLALGELADALLTGQRAVPARASALGFRFEWPTLEPALRHLLGSPTERRT